MNTYEFQASVREAERRMQAAQLWAANQRLLPQAYTRKSFIASTTPIVQWVARIVSRFRKSDVTTRIAPMVQAEAHVGPLVI